MFLTNRCYLFFQNFSASQFCVMVFPTEGQPKLKETDENESGEKSTTRKGNGKGDVQGCRRNS